MAYLDVAAFKNESTMPDEFVDDLEGQYPGFLGAQLESRSRWLDARLRKRYAVPFVAPYPATLRDWLARIVTVRAWHKRGVDPSDQQYADAREDAAAAVEEVLEAANSEAGLFDLPVDDAADASAISKGAPLAYSEQSPYVGFDVQAEIGRGEDSAGSGTGG
jgi:hypothetical protein